MAKLIIVYAYVCGDVLHKGHIEHLRNAKGLGDKLVVGVLTDKAIMERKTKPVMSFEERADVVRALKCVDVIVAQYEYCPFANVASIKPDILAESASHLGETLEEREEFEKDVKLTEKLGTRVVILPYYPGCSSSLIKSKIKGSQCL